MQISQALLQKSDAIKENLSAEIVESIQQSSRSQEAQSQHSKSLNKYESGMCHLFIIIKCCKSFCLTWLKFWKATGIYIVFSWIDVLLKNVLCSEQIGVHKEREVCTFLKNCWHGIQNWRHVDKWGRRAERAAPLRKMEGEEWGWIKL